MMHLSNVLPTLMSAVALLFSAYSLYESALRAPELAVFVAPRIDYTDPDRPESPREVFIMPITIANDGARPAVVQSVNLEVLNPRTKQSKVFYAARLGSWGEPILRPFAPVVLSGRATYSETLQFEPRVGEAVARILDSEAGGYTFRLTLDVAAAGQGGWSAGGPALEFEMQTGEIDYRYFQGRGTMAMWAPNYRPPSSAGPVKKSAP
jgi:hypothetical protein